MTYDVGIIGAGVAGTFAALRIAEKHSAKTILFDIGRPPGKRRRQIEGFLGCFPTGDGKIYPGDLEKVKDIVDGRKATPASKWIFSYLAEAGPLKLIKSAKLSPAAKKRAKLSEFEISYSNYYQWKPESVHNLSKIIAEVLEDSEHINYSFDNEVYTLRKQKGGTFAVDTAEGSFTCKKVILCVGRSGWRWVTNLYDDLGIISNDDYARFGVRVEVGTQHLKDFNKAHCTLTKGDLELGPFCWEGTIIPEDHSDLVISAFRSNEDRWKSDKVSFSLLGTHYFKDDGSVQADRVGKLSFLLFNDRVSREKVKSFMTNKSQLNMIPEYNWLKGVFEHVEQLIPNLCEKGYFHVPHIDPMAAQIRIGKNLESEIDGMFVTGESAGVRGIAAAATMGAIAADSACK
jgi:uncharacterized FAD-dependent dehydrogenase